MHMLNSSLASEQSERDTLRRSSKKNAKRIYIYIYIFITYTRKMDLSDRSVRVDYLSLFHPNNPALILGMLVGYVATDTSNSS